MNVMAFDDLFNKNSHQLTTTVICVQTLGVIMILISIVVIVACTSKLKGQPVNKIEYEPTIGRQAMLISFSVNGTMLLLYSIAMDGAAIYFRDNSLLSDLTKVHHKDSVGQPFDILYNLPIVVLLFDIVAVLFCIGALLFAVGYFCYKVHTRPATHSLSTLVPSVIGILFGIIIHSPFIAIAYINDSYYASSIFVYYMVIFFICFIAVHLSMRACLRTQLPKAQAESNIWSGIFKISKSKNASLRCSCSTIVSILLLLFLLSVVVIIICYLIIIPLNGSLSGASHQLIGFYQTIIIFLGIFITYKTVLHKKHGSLKSAIRNRKTPLKEDDSTGTKWSDLPEVEKTIVYHEMVLDLVKHLHENNVVDSVVNVPGGDNNASTSTESDIQDDSSTSTTETIMNNESDSGSDHRDLVQISTAAAGNSVTGSAIVDSGVNIELTIKDGHKTSDVVSLRNLAGSV